MAGIRLNRLSAKRRVLILRSLIIRSIRTFFFDNGFLEVETPLRIKAPAPEQNIDPISSDGWFLAASPELQMKELLAAGFGPVFQITRSFRKNERGRLHLPEFTILEWYRVNDDYLSLMRDLEKLIRYIASDLLIYPNIKSQGSKIDISCEWDRITVEDAFVRFAGWRPGPYPDAFCFDKSMAEDIEPNLGFSRPIFMYDYPVSMASLARQNHENSDTAERFELYIAGIELANGFSELIDPKEQKRRFEDEISKRHKMGKFDCLMPENFLESMSSMPPSSGVAVGIDRLVMLFSNSETIDDVVAFTPEIL